MANRQIQLYGESFVSYYNKCSEKNQEKIDFVFKLIETVRIIPVKFMKHIEGEKGLYEIRVRQGSDISRIFCFFDKGEKLILLNAFNKKSNKTPRREIKKAIKLKSQYYEERN